MGYGFHQIQPSKITIEEREGTLMSHHKTNSP